MEKRNGEVIMDASNKWSNLEYFKLTGLREYAPYMMGGGCAMTGCGHDPDRDADPISSSTPGLALGWRQNQPACSHVLLTSCSLALMFASVLLRLCHAGQLTLRCCCAIFRHDE